MISQFSCEYCVFTTSAPPVDYHLFIGYPNSLHRTLHIKHFLQFVPHVFHDYPSQVPSTPQTWHNLNNNDEVSVCDHDDNFEHMCYLLNSDTAATSAG